MLQVVAEKERIFAEAKVLAILRLKSIKLKEEEGLIFCSKYKSSIASRFRSAKLKSSISKSCKQFEKKLFKLQT